MIQYVAGAATAVFVGAALKGVISEVSKDASYLDIYKDRDEMTPEQYDAEIERKARRKIERLKKELGVE
jgi:hypothetical protein